MVRPSRLPTSFRRLVVALALGATPVLGQDNAEGWTERETRLANEYLGLLVQQPEYGRIVDLLWQLYHGHGETELLLNNLRSQAEQSDHPSVHLVLAHLLRRAGDLAAAQARYSELAEQETPAQVPALRSLADMAAEHSSNDLIPRLEALSQALPASDPGRATLWMELGDARFAAGDREGATRDWQQAAADRPGDLALARLVAQRLLQAGQIELAAAFYTTLSNEAPPHEQIQALQDLARIHEHGGDFEAADSALREALSRVHFRDDLHPLLMERRIRLHERFDRLDGLREELVSLLAEEPDRREALLRSLRDVAALTVQPEDRVRWLEQLAEGFPETTAYRWELVRARIDAGQLDEAAVELDAALETLPNSVAIMLLRAETELRAGHLEAASSRLQDFLVRVPDPEAEEAVFTFAAKHHLESLEEFILQRRLARSPDDAESLFALAAHLRRQGRDAEMETLLDGFLESATSDRRRRLVDVTSFLASSQDLTAALRHAREAVALPDAGREELLTLADLLVETDRMDEAREWLEKAWQISRSDEDRMDVDDRILPLLLGRKAAAQRAADEAKTGAEFQLPSIFTGAGFASDTTEDPPEVPRALREFASEQLERAETEPENRAQVFRAAWWSLRAEAWEDCYRMMRWLSFDPVTGQARERSLTEEKMLLELARKDANPGLLQHQLQRLIERDPEGSVRYTLRLVEHQLDAEQQRLSVRSERPTLDPEDPATWPGREAALTLEKALRRHPDNEPLMSALSRIRLLQRQPEQALQLWQDAIRNADGTQKLPLLQRYADLLLQLQELEKHIGIQLQSLELESDLQRRRQLYKRFLDRLTWSEDGAALEESVLRDRLTLMRSEVEKVARRHPFDGFYSEALAHLHSRLGDRDAAFAAMKQAYYTSPDAPFSLDQLRESALQVGDLDAAVYFQKQIAATAAPNHLARESRRLVELMEQAFRIGEADQVRRRLEQRFSQDVPALQDLASYYRQSGQDEAAARVLRQIVQVQQWDPRARLDLALHLLQLHQPAAARPHLERVLALTENDALTLSESLPPLPVSRTRPDGSSSPGSDLLELLDHTTHLEDVTLRALRGWLRPSRPEWSRLPEERGALRLRALEELGALQASATERESWQKRWSPETVDPLLALWAFHRSGATRATRTSIQRVFATLAPSVRQQPATGFAFLWLMLHADGLEEVLAWCQSIPEALDSRRNLLRGALTMLIEGGQNLLTTVQVQQLGEARLLPNPALLALVRKLEDKRRYDEALALGEWMRAHTQTLGPDYALALARMAQAAERWDLAQHYLQLVVEGPARPGAYSGVYDPYLFGLGALVQTAPSRAARDQALQTAMETLQATPDSALTTLRRAAVIGLQGATDRAADELQQWIKHGFIADRSVGRNPGRLMPQSTLRFEEAPHAHGLWEENREIQAMLNQQGLAEVTQATERRLLQQWGRIQLGPRPSYEFNEWRMRDLVRAMRATDYPNRLRLIREFLASVDMEAEASVELLSELGSHLETMQLHRESIEVYRRLPERAPTNSEYALWLLRSSEAAREVEPGRSFALHLIEAVPPHKPPTPSDEKLSEMHARFLRMAGDETELRQRGMTPALTPALPGRLPPETAYVRELARMLDERGEGEDALRSWRRLAECYTQHEDDGLEPDIECVLRQAELLIATNRSVEAKAVLNRHAFSDVLAEEEVEAAALLARLSKSDGDESGLREMMKLSVKTRSVDLAQALAKQLLEFDRPDEARDLLVQAERLSSEPEDRFALRLEQLALGSSDPADLRSAIQGLGRTRARSESNLERWVAVLQSQEDPTLWQAALTEELASGPDPLMAAVGLCALNASDGEALNAIWQAGSGDDDRRWVERAAQLQLQAGEPERARATARAAGRIHSERARSRLLPVLVETALDPADAHLAVGWFKELLRQPFPGGTRTRDWAESFRTIGREDLARELYQAATERALNAGNLPQELLQDQIRFLIETGSFKEAESRMRQFDFALIHSLDEHLFELYRASGRIDALHKELDRFHLSSGIRQAVLQRLETLQPVRP